MSAGGSTVVVGGLGDNSNTGAAWVFVDGRPKIVSIVDIPEDQGGWLRLTVNRSAFDEENPAEVATYGVWRHIPGTVAAVGMAIPPPALGAQPEAENIERLRAAIRVELQVREEDSHSFTTGRSLNAAGAFPPGTWELVASVPALQQAQYVVAVPAISNAAPNDFVVTAHTTTPSIWFASDAASGQSVDNLGPAPPTPFNGTYSAGATHLTWGANTEHDLGGYRLYRGVTADFEPGPSNLVATINTTSYDDVGPAGDYYKLSAADVNGNESTFTSLGPGQITGVGQEPLAFALEGIRPNPTSGLELAVHFVLAPGVAASLELVDVAGRRIVAREVGSLGEGRHTLNLGAGRHLAPGLYLVRLRQGVRSCNEIT